MRITGLKLTEPVHVIERNINQALIDSLNNFIPRNLNAIKYDIQAILPMVLKSSDVYKEITQGNLGAEIGIPAGEETARMDEIIDILSQQVEVQYRRMRMTGSGFFGGLLFYIFEDDFNKVLASSASTIQTDKKQDLPWMEWLLKDGDKIIIKEYEVDFRNSKASRSGKAIMIPTSGGFWKVPAQFAGVANNNWISRAITDNLQLVSDQIGIIVNKYLARLP